MVTELQKQVFVAVVRAGALTTRRVIAQYGPKPNWQALIVNEDLKEYQTSYGPVLAMSSRRRKYFRHHPPQVHVPYIAGPNAVTDRAYQNDALRVLTDQGYQMHHHDFKRAGAVGQAAREGRETTDQIVRTVVRLPDDRFAALRTLWKDDQPYQADRWGIYPQQVGYPTLYASVASGGIKLPKLKALMQRHLRDIHCWRTPLLVAVPEEGDLRAYLRAEDASHRRQIEHMERERLIRKMPMYSLCELIILPLP